MGYFGHMQVSRVLWSFFRFQGVFQLIFRFSGYFDHFQTLRLFWQFFRFRRYFGLFFFCFEGISVIFRFRRYFGHFLDFMGIFVIFYVLGVFWSFLFMYLYLSIFEIILSVVPQNVQILIFIYLFFCNLWNIRYLFLFYFFVIYGIFSSVKYTRNFFTKSIWDGTHLQYEIRRFM